MESRDEVSSDMNRLPDNGLPGSALSIAPLHNAYVMLAQAYGELLAEQERRISFLGLQLASAQQEAKQLRRMLADRDAPPPMCAAPPTM